jgi:hypothetical protein
METLQFEAMKVALKQDKTGYVLTLSLQPDEIPEALLRDWVGARYQVVMVRLNQHEEPMDRQDEFVGSQAIKSAAMLVKDEGFLEFLSHFGHIAYRDEQLATEWLRSLLGIDSRAELKTNVLARQRLEDIKTEFATWKTR